MPALEENIPYRAHTGAQDHEYGMKVPANKQRPVNVTDVNAYIMDVKVSFFNNSWKTICGASIHLSQLCGASIHLSQQRNSSIGGEADLWDRLHNLWLCRKLLSRNKGLAIQS